MLNWLITKNIGISSKIQSLSAHGKLQKFEESSMRVEGVSNYQPPQMRKKYSRRVGKLAYNVTRYYIVLNIAVNTAKNPNCWMEGLLFRLDALYSGHSSFCYSHIISQNYRYFKVFYMILNFKKTDVLECFQSSFYGSSTKCCLRRRHWF